jgi:hypothetical protein
MIGPVNLLKKCPSPWRPFPLKLGLALGSQDLAASGAHRALEIEVGSAETRIELGGKLLIEDRTS